MSVNHVILEKKTEYSPEQASYLPSKIKEIDDHLCSLIDRKIIDAAGYLMSRDGHVFAHRSMGKLRYNGEKPFKPDSIRRIASITKLFTAVCVLQLVERGKLRYDQPVADFISEFKNPMYEKIRVFHLLTHTSGLFPEQGVFFEPYPRDYGFKDKDWIIDILRGFPAIEPGKEWRYCSAGFILLGEIISRITGIKYEEYLVENIAKPLGMDDTMFFVPDELESRVCFTSEREENWFKNRKNRPDWAPPKSAGGLYSTLEDLQKFGQMLINKGTLDGVRIVSRKGVEAMTRNHLLHVKNYCWGEGGTEWEYGLGMNVYSNNTFLSPGSFAHEGAGLGGLYMDPAENFVFAYICPLNENVEWHPEPVFNLRSMAWAGIV